MKRFISFNKRFTVLDEDSVGADFLGEYRLKLSKIKPDLKEVFSVHLQNKTEVSYIEHVSIGYLLMTIFIFLIYL